MSCRDESRSGCCNPPKEVHVGSAYPQSTHTQHGASEKVPRLQISQPADLRNGISTLFRLPRRIRSSIALPGSASSGSRRRADTTVCSNPPACSRARRPTRMHASFTQIFSNHVMGRAPLVRFSRSSAARVNPFRGHLSSTQSTRIISTRMARRTPVNLSHLPHPVRHFWGSQQPQARSPLQVLTNAQEDAIKASLLETAYKGRQPGDMMLRCNVSPHATSPTGLCD